jgi:phenylacetate-CoA ligase
LFLERLWVIPLALVIEQFRRLINANPKVYALMNTAPVQPLLAALGRIEAYGVHIKARNTTPAYAAFLRKVHSGPIRGFADVPTTSKENYVKVYSIEDRCYGGRIPMSGTVIDESSGSSGTPNNWVRGPEERARATRTIQLNYGLMFGGKGNFLLNCFALGPWATGMNVSMSLAAVGILKSIGPDQVKLENTLRVFGTRYRYLVFGYPPFIKNFVDSTTLDLREFDLHAVVGGEGLSEAMRSHLERHFKTVLSSYGASDLEINIGTETPLTVALRRLAAVDAALSRDLFGRDTPPMVFQYNPLDYYVEAAESGELLFTITRLGTAAPKVRYNLHDLGGTMPYHVLREKLRLHGIDIGEIGGKRRSRFPLLYVFGRSDMTVPFYGSKISPADLENAIASDPDLGHTVNSFQFGRVDGEGGEVNLLIRVEYRENAQPREGMQDAFFDGLMRVNQDFREVTRMFARSAVRIETYAYMSGPFANRDIRIKNKYLID